MAHPELLLTPLQPWAGAGGICSPPAPHAPKSCCPGLWQQWGQIPTGTLSNELKASSLLHREHHTLSFSKSKSVAESFFFSPLFFFHMLKINSSSALLVLPLKFLIPLFPSLHNFCIFQALYWMRCCPYPSSPYFSTFLACGGHSGQETCSGTRFPG